MRGLFGLWKAMLSSVIAAGVGMSMWGSEGRVEAAELPVSKPAHVLQASYVKSELVIQFESALPPVEREALYEKYGLTEQSSLMNGLFVNVEVKEKQPLQQMMLSLQKEPTVQRAERNYHVTPQLQPSDPSYSRQWFHRMIQSPKAWDQTRGRPQVTVAVIDGGLDLTHTEFAGRIVKPYNVVANGAIVDRDRHGTHVAGIIGAAMNGAGVTGVAPGVRLMPIDVFQGEYAESYDIAEAMMYAADQGADVINLSLGTYVYSSVMEYAAAYALEKGTLVVAAAGNEGTSLPMYPAAFSKVIGVSAVDEKDHITGFSNVGRHINLSAPGENVYSTMPVHSYGYDSGTSMAAPVVSGTAALVLSKNPFLTPQQVMRILYQSSVDLGHPSMDDSYGHGRVDAHQALALTPKPMGAISLNTKEFRMTGKTNIRAALSVRGSMRGLVYVEDASGRRVRTLINGELPKQGGFVAYWNGKQDNGDFAPAGKYSVVFRLADNRQSLSQRAEVQVIPDLPPVITADAADMTMTKEKPSAKVTFAIDRSLFITAAVYNEQGKLVKPLLTRKALPARRHHLSWDGTNGNLKKMPPGDYQIILTGTDLQNNSTKETVWVRIE
ncbi:S8 family serine peptidase [Bacillus thermotolerans]|uniref:Alkaline protease n=1 Tax=Bacillus thermotolerans TaxID=1221996 RepID=A0A0F5I7Q8_BACTR|nr:S8 family serine peptidase [Bacillus thermotolerans]KKB41207.1 Alkaline protease precursor [Bacillus thermotolerans]